MGQLECKSLIKETNMSHELVSFSIQTVDQVVKHHRAHKTHHDNPQATGAHLYDDQRICDDINRLFLASYGGKWFCLAGPHAVFPELKRPPKFIYFEYSTGWSYGSQKYRVFIYSYD